MAVLAAIAAFVAVASFLSYVALRRPASSSVERRLARLAKPSEQSDAVKGGGLLRSGSSRLPLLRRVLAGRAISDRWQLDLEQAGLRVKVSEYLLLRLLVAAVAGLLGLLIAGAGVVGLIIAVVLGAIGYSLPMLYVQLRKSRRRDALNGQLVEMLEMVSNSLRSGFAFVQALELAARQLKPPIKDELEALLNDISLGARNEDALRAFADRTSSVDVELIVTTILVQRTSGGNLSEVLDNVAATIRERERLEGDIHALTAQQRFTGLVLGFYPVVLALLFFAMSPDLMSVLWEESLGRILVAIAATLQLLGILTIRRILRLEV